MPDTNFEIFDYEPTSEDFRAAVIAGLTKLQKEVPSKFIYDERGSEIFAGLANCPSITCQERNCRFLRIMRKILQISLGRVAIFWAMAAPPALRSVIPGHHRILFVIEHEDADGFPIEWLAADDLHLSAFQTIGIGTACIIRSTLANKPADH
jgi:hypothetical protein